MPLARLRPLIKRKARVFLRRFSVEGEKVVRLPPRGVFNMVGKKGAESRRGKEKGLARSRRPRGRLCSLCKKGDWIHTLGGGGTWGGKGGTCRVAASRSRISNKERKERGEKQRGARNQMQQRHRFYLTKLREG